MATQNDKPVWFITGCSTGFGREIARKTLSLGYPTVITARNPSTLADLANEYADLALVLELDVMKAAQIEAATRAAIERFGRIDVLVNNAGIGYFGSFEESERDEVRTMFDINVWGLADMTRAVLPQMRKQRSGTIVNISSVGGIIAFPALSFYNATKFAVEALSESLSQELAPLGIKVLVVEPGPFRTDWAGRSANQAPQTIDDYANTAKARTDMIRGYSGKQPGDPVRAADAIVKAVESENPPLRLLLGKAALANARLKLDALKRDFDGWETVSAGADFPEG
ncbi:oxidoreductase [Paraburkholderia caballeronis]|uniref:oxidoreductase n=1 Tax=Paraburkholderia caballeronis TaxID=416943 RepID=UPI0010657241|nr:oxidoreductase [Paraburkholderia caballeronis]TDV03063.1 NADP-dependent 3-hydroxy acid dehydrogenase YdfG [Paraburkholderia caballeronis]TDV08385.1 NADP-dependent 3-hydroxy acid dehydrogenase YdfG [Paraburkholderia caballeronis]TDV19742.1 NADP-dependent 3-hydroxy acid dehydrogenase YdfG [Paraburkholderia caballeronis]TDV33997.1 NADP-dependent 3-hydroxy acid dehydrogenase YdfG [Paraburkholderia caballeronis]